MTRRSASAVGLAGIVITLLQACNPDESADTQDTIAPDPEAVQLIDDSSTVDDFQFQTTETIDGVSYGLMGDGRTNNSAVFRSLLSNGDRTIHIPAGDYVTDRLSLASNTILVLESGVVIRDSGSLNEGERFINIVNVENIRIDGLGAAIVARRSDYTDGEQRHGIFVYGARSVMINGLESSSHSGDGFYIGGPSDNPSTDILLRGCLANNNRRQGLSITSARRVRIIDCEFVNTAGTAPEFGVDLEPNNPRDFLDDIVLIRPHTRSNRGGGIMIHLEHLDASSHPVDITVSEHLSITEAPSLRTHVPNNVSAVLRYSEQ